MDEDGYEGYEERCGSRWGIIKGVSRQDKREVQRTLGLWGKKVEERGGKRGKEGEGGYLKALNELDDMLWTRKRVRVGLEDPKQGPLFRFQL